MYSRENFPQGIKKASWASATGDGYREQNCVNFLWTEVKVHLRIFSDPEQCEGHLIVQAPFSLVDLASRKSARTMSTPGTWTA